MRHRLDLSVADLLAARAVLRSAPDADTLDRRVARAFLPAAPDTIVPAYTVRSGFHAALAALAFPPGSEVLFSGISIHAMAHIPAAHGLVAVPVDLDEATLAPDLAALERHVTPRTRALVVAHLYGGRVDLAPYVAFARRHAFVLFEDCAQAFAGVGDAGPPDADVAMFSFGMVKTATAISGAVLRVNDPALRTAIRGVMATWPTLPDAQLAKRVKTAATIHVVSQRPFYDAFVLGCDARGVAIDDVINRAVKAFPIGELVPQIQHRPSPALLALLARRLETFDPGRVRARAERGEWLLERIAAKHRVPGRAARDRTWWMFPVVAPDPARLLRALRAVRLDATQASTAMAALERTDGGPQSAGPTARAVLRDVVYVPAYPEIPRSAFDAVPDAIDAALATPETSP